MRLHNKLKIIKGNSVFESFNNLLLPAVEFLSENKSYFSFVAIGGASDDTVESQTTLLDYAKTYPLQLKECNLNPLNGDLYITKTLTISEEDKTPLKIGEVGVTADGEAFNPKVANRFVVNNGNAIFRDPGEEISLEITIFLELGDVKQVAFTACENSLVQFLLGDYSQVPFFSVARGFNTTSNSEIISRDLTGIELFPAWIETELDENLKTLDIKIISDLGEGVVEELLLILDNKVVARCNTSEAVGGGLSNEFTSVADDDNMLTLTKAGISSISCVTDLTTGTELTDYVLSTYGTTFAGGFSEIFTDKGYTSATPRVISKELNKIGFIHDGTMDIYDLSGDIPELMPCQEPIVTTNGYLYTIIKNQLVIKYHDETAGTYDASCYLFQDGQWIKSKYQLSVANASWYPGINKNEEWFDLDVAPTDSEEDTFYAIASYPYFWVWKGYVNTYNNLTYRSSKYNSYYRKDYVSSMNPSNRITGARFCGYNSPRDVLLVSDGLGNYYEYTDVDAVDIAKNYRADGYPKFAKNFVFSMDKQNKQLKTFSIDSESAKIVPFDASAQDFYISEFLDYMAVRDESGDFKLYYLDGSLNLYEFSGGLPETDSEIIDLIFVKDKIFVFTADGKMLSVKINKNKMILNGVTKGDTIKVEYLANNTPGASGGNVRAVVKLRASV